MDQGPRRKPFRPQRNQPRHDNNPRHQGAHRGNSQQHAANASSKYERYTTLAKDAARRGETIEAENLYQHAEHYFRMMRERE